MIVLFAKLISGLQSKLINSVAVIGAGKGKQAFGRVFTPAAFVTFPVA